MKKFFFHHVSIIYIVHSNKNILKIKSYFYFCLQNIKINNDSKPNCLRKSQSNSNYFIENCFVFELFPYGKDGMFHLNLLHATCDSG